MLEVNRDFIVDIYTLAFKEQEMYVVAVESEVQRRGWPSTNHTTTGV